ncbi:PAS domain-containing hybrid sensor histidine kinase/response regulator [Phenylobacterium sp.]|uniref:hybrid sensor histidine kinase/response regulator n=1 Tax=Phenylobacterium sp. TaxID=1871053 RepID=UPI0025F54728|nr:PAS domain-containing hybrid sensor histidine kinase/response regulator [Phenylobacterium sp.]
MLELDRMGVATRVGFAGLFGLASLLAIPWVFTASWLAAIVIWEAISVWVINPWTMRLPPRAGVAAFASRNVVGGSVYGLVALAGLAIGTPLGAVMGAVWLSGAFMNNFVYHGENRRILVASLAPSIAIAILGPQIGHGLTLESAGASGLILTMFLAARAFSLDHQVLLKRLGERQTALADVERKLSLAIDASGDGTFDVDLINGQGQVSAGWARMMGYGPDEVTHELFSYVHPEDAPVVQQAFDAHFAGESPHTATEQRMRCKDGGYKWVLARASLVERTDDGRPARVIGTTTDISERKALELDLKGARDVAEAANLAKTTFLANMSHEIRTPLNGVIGIASVLARTELAPAQREMVGVVQSSAQILERLLTDILDQSKLEAGEFALVIAPFDVRAAVAAAAELMRTRAEEKGLEFALDFAPSAEGLFEGDAVRLSQIVSNLTANAIKFTETGAVRVSVEANDATGADAPVMVTIKVADTGIGFDEVTATRLFTRFVQADDSISRRFGGTGLGLAISKALAKLMGGDVSAVSASGEGSVFTLALPLRRAVLASAPREDAEPGDEGVELAGLRVLVAEDHPTNQRVIQLMLEPMGVALTMTSDGREAIEAFSIGAFDFVLMDMQMPKMDGLSATREIRRRERDAGAGRTPIAMLTANALDEHRRMAAQAGADHLIAKPITPESLFRGLTETFAAARREVEAAA